MKGGSEAQASNRVLGQLIRDAVASVDASCVEAIQMVETREDVHALLALDEYIDLFIPRGSNAFVRYIQEHTRVPVLGHSEGLCHAYVDQHADLGRAVCVCYDAKVQYPAGVQCRSRLVLVHRQHRTRRFYPCWRQCIAKRGSRCADVLHTRTILPDVLGGDRRRLGYRNISISSFPSASLTALRKPLPTSISTARAIPTPLSRKPQRRPAQFLEQVDSATVMHNASTRFADGFRFGKGAEVGISTNKTHARGPVGLDGLVIYKYRLVVARPRGSGLRGCPGDSRSSIARS